MSAEIPLFVTLFFESGMLKPLLDRRCHAFTLIRFFFNLGNRKRKVHLYINPLKKRESVKA